jgi:HEAT repeat protein
MGDADILSDQLQATYVRQTQQQKQATYRALFLRAYGLDEDSLRVELRGANSAKRIAAAYVIGERQLPWQSDLIDRLTDSNSVVRQAARRSLVILSYFALRADGDDTVIADFGPALNAGSAEQERAAKDWRSWWSDRGETKTEVRTDGQRTDLDTNAARLSAALVFAQPGRQDGLLTKYRDTKGIEYTEALANALAQLDGVALQNAREYLAQRLTRMTAETLRQRLGDPRAEVRRATALAWATKEDSAAIPELIPLLEDPDDCVRPAARTALKHLTGQNFGPRNDANARERAQAVTEWKSWWQNQRPDR